MMRRLSIQMSDVPDSLSVVYIPIQVIVCIVFLYQILGWSSFIGAITMVILFPLPGWVANQMQYVEAEKLKQVCFLLYMKTHCVLKASRISDR